MLHVVRFNFLLPVCASKQTKTLRGLRLRRNRPRRLLLYQPAVTSAAKSIKPATSRRVKTSHDLCCEFCLHKFDCLNDNTLNKQIEMSKPNTINPPPPSNNAFFAFSLSSLIQNINNNHMFIQGFTWNVNTYLALRTSINRQSHNVIRLPCMQ